MGCRIKVSGVIVMIIFILLLAIALIYPYYRIVRELYLPRADSFWVFFNYYYPIFTRYTFEVDEEEEEEKEGSS